MKLTPKELDRLTIFSAAELARKRRLRGVRLNHPEALALISDELLEDGRDGKSYEDVMEHAAHILSSEDVMEGVLELLTSIRLEVNFLDGNKLVYVENPIR